MNEQLELIELMTMMSELEASMSAMEDKNFFGNTDALVADYEKAMALVDEIKRQGICRDDVAKLKQMNLLVGAVESEYTTYRSNFKQLEGATEASNKALEAVLTGVYAAIAAVVAYVSVMILGKLFGLDGGSKSDKSSGGSGGSSGLKYYPVRSLISRKLSSMNNITKTTGDVLARVFGGEADKYIRWNNVIGLLEVADETPVIYQAFGLFKKEIQERADFLNKRDDYSMYEGKATMLDIYGDKRLPLHVLNLIENTWKIASKIYPTDAKLDRVRAPYMVYEAIKSDGYRPSQAIKPENITGKFKLDVIDKRLEGLLKNAAKELEKLGDEIEELGTILAKELKGMPTHPALIEFMDAGRFANLYLREYYVKPITELTYFIVSMDAMFRKLENQHRASMKAVRIADADIISDSWNNPKDGEIDLKAMRRAYERVEITSETTKMLQMIDALLAAGIK